MMEQLELIQLVGEGSFGRVYRARKKADDQEVGHPARELRSIRQECDIQRTLLHPNIVQLLDSFETTTEIGVITEFIDGSLHESLQLEGSFSEERVQPITCQLLAALHFLHSHRILHRDLKPQNILLGAHDLVKLCDFGFARSMGLNTYMLTSIRGTPLYMAPELIEEKAYNHSADLWSLGCILYEMLTSRPPFCANTIVTLVKSILHENVPEIKSSSSKTCQTFVMGLLQKNPNNRMGWQQILEHSFVSSGVQSLLEEEPEEGDKENHWSLPDVEAEEWRCFLHKTLEEVLESTDILEDANLLAVLLAPLHSPEVPSSIMHQLGCILLLPFHQISKSDEHVHLRHIYLETKVLPNLLYACKMLVQNPSTKWSTMDLEALDCMAILMCHLVHRDANFLLQFCDSVLVLNAFLALQTMICMDNVNMWILAILNHVLQELPEQKPWILNLITQNEYSPSAQVKMCLLISHLLHSQDEIFEWDLTSVIECLQWMEKSTDAHYQKVGFLKQFVLPFHFKIWQYFQESKRKYLHGIKQAKKHK